MTLTLSKLSSAKRFTKIFSCLAAIIFVAFSFGSAPAQNSAPAAGELDPTFDGDGLVVTEFSANSADQIFAMAVQTDGKTVVVGTTRAEGATFRKYAAARYNTDGALDTTFDTDGKGEYSPFLNNHEGRDVAVLPDGKILIAGRSGQDFGVIRLTAAGALDTTLAATATLRPISARRRSFSR